MNELSRREPFIYVHMYILVYSGSGVILNNFETGNRKSVYYRGGGTKDICTCIAYRTYDIMQINAISVLTT